MEKGDIDDIGNFAYRDKKYKLGKLQLKFIARIESASAISQ